MTCTCFIIPKDVLDRLSRDKKLPEDVRKHAADSARVSTQVRKVRDAAGELTNVSQSIGAHIAQLAATPKVTVSDCKTTQTLPGTPVSNPGSSTDATAKRTFKETTSVAAFYKKGFNRNSIDDAGMTLMSSIHFGVKYNNAMWNGTQMLYIALLYLTPKWIDDIKVMPASSIELRLKPFL